MAVVRPGGIVNMGQGGKGVVEEDTGVVINLAVELGELGGRQRGQMG